MSSQNFETQILAKFKKLHIFNNFDLTFVRNCNMYYKEKGNASSQA